MSRKPKKKDLDRKPRYCDPGACGSCLYLGEGDFLCDEHQEIVVADWQPTRHHLMCKRRRRE